MLVKDKGNRKRRKLGRKAKDLRRKISESGVPPVKMRRGKCWNIWRTMNIWKWPLVNWKNEGRPKENWRNNLDLQKEQVIASCRLPNSHRSVERGEGRLRESWRWKPPQTCTGENGKEGKRESNNNGKEGEREGTLGRGAEVQSRKWKVILVESVEHRIMWENHWIWAGRKQNK